jgi:hypothetical protein
VIALAAFLSIGTTTNPLVGAKVCGSGSDGNKSSIMSDRSSDIDCRIRSFKKSSDKIGSVLVLKG